MGACDSCWFGWRQHQQQQCDFSICCCCTHLCAALYLQLFERLLLTSQTDCKHGMFGSVHLVRM